MPLNLMADEQNNHIQEIEQSVIVAQNVIDKNNKTIKAIE